MANIIEEQLIIKYDTTNNLNGYNIMFGGNNCKLPDFVKKKISESKTGQKLSEETIDMLDEIDISSVDMDIRGYDWEVNGKTGKSAYLQAINVIQNIDRFGAKYAADELPF